jgi:hypothetical protein
MKPVPFQTREGSDPHQKVRTPLQQITEMQRLLVRDANKANVKPADRVRITDAWLSLEKMRLVHIEDRRTRRRSLAVAAQRPEPAMIEDDPAAAAG